ncbi:MAG: hypothetical protein KZQ76_05265 [Candidatus Thiodiazotropha sp. (ex Epidulcina cf. delphinae)]|nr:hypothetical protein [Candidatus Thiodiazotropha sp. (ex Epidulcina cf. delphinae)]
MPLIKAWLAGNGDSLVGRLQRRFDALLQAGTLRLKVHYLVAGLINTARISNHEGNHMIMKEYLLSSLIVLVLFGISDTIHARNCKKGKPCGNACIASGKTCRIGAGSMNRGSARSDKTPPSTKDSTLRKSRLRLPKLYIVTAGSIEAKDSPYSDETTGRFKEGQTVFVYETFNSWARLTNMQPDQWVKLEYLQLK